MTLTINLALDESIQRKELEKFSGVLSNGLDRSMLFKQDDILLKGNSILEIQNLILKPQDLHLCNLLTSLREKANSNLDGAQEPENTPSVRRFLTTDKLLTISLIEMFPNIFDTEIPDNFVTFSSVISVYPFPFFSNRINGNVYNSIKNIKIKINRGNLF